MAKSSSSGRPLARPKFVTGDGELGKIYNVDTQTVYRWRKAGMPCKKDGRQWRYWLVKTDKWVAAYRKEFESAEDSTDLNADLKKEKLAQERVRTKMLARKLETQEGDLLPRIAWERFGAELLVRLGDLCNQLPDLIGAECCPVCREKIKARLGRELDAWRESSAEHLKGQPSQE